jgi:hypothetical protein
MRAPIALAWGEYFEPSWSDLSAAIDVARKANGDQPVMTLEESRALLAPLLGLEGDATAVAGEQQKWVDATSAALSPVAAAADGAAAVADTALNGAQTASLVEIGEKLQSGLITEAFARVAIRKAFPTFSPADVEEALSGAQAQPTETRTP